MATQTFTEAMGCASEMCLTDPNGKEYKGFYADPKIDRSTLPVGWHCYDFRHDDNGRGIFATLEADYVIVNNAGCFFTQTEIPELKEHGSWIEMSIDPEESDWEWTFC